MLPFVEDLDVEQVHVHAPTEVVFLCGGPFALPSEPPASLRDAFNRISLHPALGDREILQAESITRLHLFSSFYQDFLRFESDFAEITELIILFCESAGSFAELGSFASNAEIAKRLLVVIRDHYAVEGSYINLGPLAFMRRVHEHSVFVVSDTYLGLQGTSYASIDIDRLKAVLDTPLRTRVSAARSPTTFTPARPGHQIKLIVGLIQEYGALTVPEIIEAAALFGVELTTQRTGALLLCAREIGWINHRMIGFRDMHFAIERDKAAEFRIKPTASNKDGLTRRLAIRAHWKANDNERFLFVSDVAGGGA